MAKRSRSRSRKKAKPAKRVKRATRSRKPAKRRAPRRAARKATKKYGRRRDLGAPIDGYLKKLDDGKRAIVLRLREIVKSAVPGVQEALKWGMPVWSKDGLLCYAHPTRAYVRFGYYKPNIIDDAAGLTVEGGPRMTHVKLTSASQVVAEAFRNWTLRAAAQNV